MWLAAAYNVTELLICFCMHGAELKRAELARKEGEWVRVRLEINDC